MMHPVPLANERAAISREIALVDLKGRALLVIALISAILFAIRLFTPPNLLDQDQERPASYVLDAVQNGQWICQRDWTGDITSKPPLWTWLSALVTLASGRISEFSLYLPGALAGFGTALLTYRLGLRNAGFRASLLAAVAVLLTTAGAKQFGLARVDGVFAFFVTAAAFRAWCCWRSGRGWAWFWLLAAAATLTKGPLGVLFAAAGLMATLWEHRTGSTLPLRGHQLTGIVLFLVITAGWLLLAYQQWGSAVTDKLLGKELIGHVGDKNHFPGSQFYKQPLYYLGRAAPWSLFAYLGLWRIWARPSPDDASRRFERFLFCWFAIGLLMLSLASHQRADLLWPIMPAGALIAGMELDRLLNGFARQTVWQGLAAALLAALGGFAVYYTLVPPRTRIVRQTVLVKDVASSMRKAYPGEFPFTYVDAPMTLQVYLNTSRKAVPLNRAIRLLRGKKPAAIAVNEITASQVAARCGDSPLHTVFQTPALDPERSVRILSNQASREMESFAFVSDNWFVAADHVMLLAASEQQVKFRALAPSWELEIKNEAKGFRTWEILVEDLDRTAVRTETIGPGCTFRFAASGEAAHRK